MASTDVAKLNLDAINGLITEDFDREVSFTSIQEAIAAAGLAEDRITIASSYRVVSDKKELVNVPLFITSARFAEDQDTERNYVVLYAVSGTGESIIITDGSTGIFQQVVKEVAKRVDAGHPTPMQSFYVPNGLRVSEYGIDKSGQPVKKGEKPDSIARTYYLS